MSTTPVTPTTKQKDGIPVVEFDLDSELELSLTPIGEFLSDLNGDGVNGKGKEKEGADTESTTDTDSQRANLLDPIALSQSITTTYVKDLLELLQSRDFNVYNLKTVFQDEEMETENHLHGFTNTLKIVYNPTENVVKELKPHGCFPSKKHAKEAVAGLGIQYVKELPEEITSLPRTAGSSCVSVGPVETEDWVGLLQNWCQNKGPYPQYSWYASAKTPPEFSCDITDIPELGSMVLGDKTKFYRTKKLARVQAAKAAMLWIRANPPSAPASPQSPSGNNDQQVKFVGKVPVAPPGSTIRVAAKTSPLEKVSIICPQLGLSLPDYKFTQDERALSIYDITAILRRREGKSVKVGPLKGQYGRVNAKKKLAECIIRWLDKEAERKQVTIEIVES